MKTILTMVTAGILALPALAAADGMGDYKAYCAGCHGANGFVQTEKAKALKMDPKRLSLLASTKNRAEMAAVIKAGRGEMPGFGKQLSRERIAAIVDYVQTLRNNR